MPSHFPQARQALRIAEATASPSWPERRTRLTSRRSCAACRLCDAAPSVLIDTSWEMASRAGCIQTTTAILPRLAPCIRDHSTPKLRREGVHVLNGNTPTQIGEV